ncbi:galanin receptor 2a-like [Saccoglossus kowalevskii]|uniref:Galanin receptor type 2-like n=1 Tax=Saccoglossus kowalevskii TaxID=10224 RepID=A0ABM0MI70_SACKO|nr:PREDICTED: galanin receptor type 2-like [Saccoglossus kowalevskii]
MSQNNATHNATFTIPSSEQLPLLNIVFGLIGILGLLGNLLVCVVFLRVRHLRTLTNILIVHQAIIDLTSSAIAVLAYLGPQFNYTSNSIGGEIICRVWKSGYLFWSTSFVSSTNLVVITLERYSAIIHPLHHTNLFTVKRVIVILITEWLCALAFKSFNIYVQYFDRGLCFPIKIWFNAEFGRFVGITNVIAQFIVPLLVMSVAYTRCIMALRKKSGADVQVGDHEQDSQLKADSSLKRASRNVLKMLVMVFVAFALCWGPNQIMFLSFCLGFKLDFGSTLYHASVISVYVNSSVNPFIYALKYKQFQNGVRLIFGCKNINAVENSGSTRVNGPYSQQQ